MVTTVRDALLEELLGRLKKLPGYTAERRKRGENDANHRKLALLLGGDETVQGSNTVFTTKEMAVEVFVQVRDEDAPADLDKNPERFLDQALGEVEKALFTPPWLTHNEALEPLGLFFNVDPASSLMRGVVQLSVTYRHNVGDPTTYNPTFT